MDPRKMLKEYHIKEGDALTMVVASEHDKTWANSTETMMYKRTWLQARLSFPVTDTMWFGHCRDFFKEMAARCKGMKTAEKQKAFETLVEETEWNELEKELYDMHTKFGNVVVPPPPSVVAAAAAASAAASASAPTAAAAAAAEEEPVKPEMKPEKMRIFMSFINHPVPGHEVELSRTALVSALRKYIMKKVPEGVKVTFRPKKGEWMSDEAKTLVSYGVTDGTTVQVVVRGGGGVGGVKKGNVKGSKDRKLRVLLADITESAEVVKEASAKDPMVKVLQQTLHELMTQSSQSSDVIMTQLKKKSQADLLTLLADYSATSNTPSRLTLLSQSLIPSLDTLEEKANELAECVQTATKVVQMLYEKEFGSVRGGDLTSTFVGKLRALLDEKSTTKPKAFA